MEPRACARIRLKDPDMTKEPPQEIVDAMWMVAVVVVSLCCFALAVVGGVLVGLAL
jgi:hypothetical protein